MGVYNKIIVTRPASIGISMLSLIGEGIDSINIPAVAAKKPLIGSMKNRVPRKAKKSPERVPSSFFDLLKGRRVLPNLLPKIDAELSPKVRTAIAT